MSSHSLTIQQSWNQHFAHVFNLLRTIISRFVKCHGVQEIIVGYVKQVHNFDVGCFTRILRSYHDLIDNYIWLQNGFHQNKIEEKYKEIQFHYERMTHDYINIMYSAPPAEMLCLFHKHDDQKNKITTFTLRTPKEIANVFE